MNRASPTGPGGSARLFAAALEATGDLRVVMWDESLSTQDARRWRMASGASRKRRAGRIDAAAAAVILQSYLDAQDNRESQGNS